MGDKGLGGFCRHWFWSGFVGHYAQEYLHVIVDRLENRVIDGELLCLAIGQTDGNKILDN